MSITLTPEQQEQLEQKQAQLAEVRAAISKVLTHGRTYMIQDGGAMRQLGRASLKELTELEQRLELEVSRLCNGGIRINYGMPQ